MIPGTVKSITVSGVYGQGDYDLSTGKWKFGANDPSSTYVIEPKDASVKAGEIKPLTDKTSALMMIPQDFGPDAKAKVSMVFNDGATDKTVSFRLNGTSWDAGNHITYMLSSSKITTLKMGKLTYPSGWDSVNDGATSKIRKAYDEPNSSVDAGLFVVNEENKVIAANVNVKLTRSGTSLSLPPGSKLKFSPMYHYFLYYPYQTNLTGLPAVNTPGSDVSSSITFFAKAIANWKIATDQSTLKKMNDCDLQIGKASLDDEDGCSVSFEMEHAMALAEIKLGIKTILKCTNYLPCYDATNSSNTYEWKVPVRVRASSNINGYNMYKTADYSYVSIVRPGNTTFNSVQEKSDVNRWKQPLSFENLAYNTYASKVAESQQEENPNKREPYTVAVGDVYYSDGSISHYKEELLYGKIPVGIVVYIPEATGADYWAERGSISGKTYIGGHGLVMCLKTINSTGSTDFGKGYRWSSSSSDEKNIPNVTSKVLIVDSKNQTSGSGYTMTAALINIGSEAATAAKNYNTLPAPSSKCTGWFLPSAGQYYAAMSQLGGGMSLDWEIGTFFGNMKDVTTKINDNLKKVGDDSKYTEFFQGRSTWAWTSSEYSSTDAVFIDSGVDESKESGSVRFFGRNNYGSKTSQLPVRPFLAF